MSGLDVLVVPSTWYENSPVVISEALAAGRPVIATNLGGIISGYTVPATATYYVRVAGASLVPYDLVVNRNAGFDTEPNDAAATAKRLKAQSRDAKQKLKLAKKTAKQAAKAAKAARKTEKDARRTYKKATRRAAKARDKSAKKARGEKKIVTPRRRGR